MKKINQKLKKRFVLHNFLGRSYILIIVDNDTSKTLQLINSYKDITNLCLFNQKIEVILKNIQYDLFELTSSC